MAEPLTMTLLVDTKSCRVLFAEANEDVADFIFGLLAMPLGSIVKLLSKEQMVGSMGNVYRSLENLDTAYIQSNFDKTILLSPKIPSSSSFRQQSTLLLADTAAPAKSYYNCGERCSHYTDVSGTTCPDHRRPMTNALQYTDPKRGKADAKAKDDDGGCVKGVGSYTFMDDLSVSPTDTTASSIALLNISDVKDVGVLKEEIVKVGMQEGLKLLKASLKSKTVLTDVFLPKKK